MDNFQKKIVLRAMDNLADLTEWETDFIQSLAGKDDLVLSVKQRDALNRILRKLDDL